MSSIKESDNQNKFWRSLDELQGTPEFENYLHREFPEAASEFPEGISRRRWMQLMGASLSLAGVAGCRWEEEKIAPFANRPANRTPGIPQKFATMVNRGGYASSLVVTSYDGRPIKVEGNVQHPDSLGATSGFDQAEILSVYDPNRVAPVTAVENGKAVAKTWADAVKAIQAALAASKGRNGAGLAILTENNSSLTLSRLLEKVKELYPESSQYQFETSGSSNEWAGSELAFGQVLRPQYDIAKANIVLCLDADLVGRHPGAVTHTRAWAGRRTPETGEMNRWYVAESQYTATGAGADHRLPVKSTSIPALLARIEAALNAGHASEQDEKFVQAVVDDLLKNKGTSIVVAGPQQPAEVHAAVVRVNNLLENLGSTVNYINEPLANNGSGSINDLAAAIDAGEVSELIILGGNPVYAAPHEVRFGEKLAKVGFSAHLGVYRDETSRLCQWHLPASHNFEEWGDGISYSGVPTVQQPLIDPIQDTKSEIEVLSLIVGEEQKADRVLVSETFRDILPADGFEKAFRKAVHDGFVAVDATTQTVTPAIQDSLASVSLDALKPNEHIELTFNLCDSVYDGRYANNGWLQETPDPMTKLTWDNVALISKATADRLGIKNFTYITVSFNANDIDIPAYIMPGQADDSIALALGYGRTAAGSVGGLVGADAIDDIEDVDPVGVNVNVLRTTETAFLGSGAQVSPTGRPADLASTQEHHLIDKAGMEEIQGRMGDLVREAQLEEYKLHPDFAKHRVHEPPLESLWEDPIQYDGKNKWGMSIDLSRCIGCNACSLACQSENNVPIVGKDQVSRGREMHWLRMDRYFKGDIEDPQVVSQPVVCQQCENAPCEQVCPVAATVHSDEGLNDMAYNRCIGTRYCGNNCPYKVRRFNFLNYNKQYEKEGHELVSLILNPEVTLRHRGVMEKCTFCIQRIQNGKIVASNENRDLVDGEIKTACQEVCPAGAIEFGDLNQEGSRIAVAHANDRAYAMLSELNVRPRNKYLARIRNPHPLLAEPFDAHGGHHDDHHDEHHGDDHGHDEHKHEEEHKDE